MKNKWEKRIGVFVLSTILGMLLTGHSDRIIASAAATEWQFKYTRTTEAWTCPADGWYKLEVWGAQGGGREFNCSDTGHFGGNGGYGSYASGEKYITKGTVLYISCGEPGEYLELTKNPKVPNKLVNNFGDYLWEYTPFNSNAYYKCYWDERKEEFGSDGSPAYETIGAPTSITTTNTTYYATAAGNVLVCAGGGYPGSAYCRWDYQEDCSDDGYCTGTNGSVLVNNLSNPVNKTGVNGWKCVVVPDGRYNCKESNWPAHPGWQCGNGWGKRYDCTHNGMQGKAGYAKITSLHTHTYTSKITTNPTCTKDGIRTYTCTGSATDAACGHQYTEIIPKLNHDCSVVVPLGTKGYEVPGRPGYFYTRKCSRCGSHYCREELGQFLQQTFVKYMDTNGNYPNDWKLADSKLVIYDQYYSWEYADRQEFKGNSVYYKVTKANDNYVYIERKKYQQQVIVYYQNADGLGDADATFTPITEVSGDYFYGSQVTWKYTPRVEYNDTVTSSRRDGTVQTSLTYNITDHKVTEFWAFRKLVTLDINGEYLWKSSVDASDESGTKYKYPNLGYSATDSNNNMGTFDIYINGKLDTQKGHNVRDYYRNDILYGSKWEVENIESDAGKHYYGSDVN